MASTMLSRAGQTFSGEHNILSRAKAAPIVYTTLLAATIYLATGAPGLTWANHGADGGELIAAAMQNGVPHPPGYPLYILFLQGWIWFGELILPSADRAWLGNLLSAFCAALSVGLTVWIIAHLLSHLNQPRDSAPAANREAFVDEWSVWGCSVVAAMAWAVAPLFWGQALITEVYALHLLLTILLAWSLLVKNGHPLYIIPSVAFGIAHHLTFVLLLPAALYWLLFRDDFARADFARSAESNTDSNLQADRSLVLRLTRALLFLGLGGLLGALFYLRIPLAASSGPPPINWGYADSWSGFLWLISADAYRPYLFGLPTSSILQRVSAWAYMTTAQYTVVGLAFGLLGLSYLDRNWPRFRTFCLLWAVPTCVYAIGYHTRDSEIYLLPFFWMVALWLGVGLWFGASVLAEWLATRKIRLNSMLYPLIGLLLVLILGAVRWGDVSLRADRAAIDFLEDAKQLIEPNSIVYSSSDAETFALWYGAWGVDESWQPDSSDDQEDGKATDKPVLVNSALLQFEWYQRLISERYVDVAGIDELTLDLPVSQALIDNIENRPIYFSEEPSYVGSEHLEVVGRFWRYVDTK